MPVSSLRPAAWDSRISRQHAELTYKNGRLLVRRLPTGKNPIFVSGRESASFERALADYRQIVDQCQLRTP